ncbi:Hnrnpu [Symbiodinium natans]|uniref:Hnrnpu protein n=1 Tax=Symbiodinium natans TaxID=878477 RepID=A0A812I564_9DINO|nr:Hnrnpu [Symbiodinium natans]
MEEKPAEAEKPAEPEEPQEQEKDAEPLSGPKVKCVGLNSVDSTLNVIASGRMVRTLTEGGMQYLLACIRADTGIKSGRYMFEVRIVEAITPLDTGERTPTPKQLLRVGFSLAGSSLFLADGCDSFCFDSEGLFIHDKSRKKAAPKFKDATVAVLLNLDQSSPNKNTVSLFLNGTRQCPPQPIPEHLCGKPLYPTLSYKNVSVEVNFGPTPRKALPFSCHMLASAAAADVEASPCKAANKKPEVVLPVGLPSQGYFDWVDEFVERNPGYVELSDRKILEWAQKSGLWKPKGGGSLDKPEGSFGVPALDDWSVRRVLQNVSPCLNRSYVIGELKANLIAGDREATLSRFNSQDFARKAVVVMGEPTAEYKARVQSLILAEKKSKAEQEQKRKAQAEERKRMLELKRKKAEEARKAKEAAQKKKEGKDDKEDNGDDAKVEEAEENEDVKMEEAAVVELTEEEKSLSYRTGPVPDISDRELTKSFAKFSIPTQEEGFDAVSFAWQAQGDCAALLKKWILQKKLTQRAEDLQPGAGFKEVWTKWQKTIQEWRRRHAEYKEPSKRKALAAKKLEDAKKTMEEEKKKLMEAGDEDAAKALEEKFAQDTAPVEVNFDDLDVFAVEDVMDLGNCMPLFANFVYEDWTLLTLRAELHLLLHSFKKDLDDPDRPGFVEAHLAYYYQKYFKKSWNFGQYGLAKFTDLLDIMKDALTVDSTSNFLQAVQAEDVGLETFLKYTEDHRRERERRVDAGDETAKLKFTRPTPPPTRQADKGKGSVSGGKGSRPPQSSYESSYYSNKRPYQSSGGPPAKQPRTSYGSYGGYGRR